MMAANPALNMPSSAAAEPWNSNPRNKNRSAPIRFQVFPAMGTP
jgi:hypothetical protein